MMPTFRLSIRLLGDSFHGRGDGGEPEWPPSPLRAFQALVNAAAGRCRTTQFESQACPALEWLEGLGRPDIFAPVGRPATRPYRLYVPNNAGDLMTAAWARGDIDASMAGHRTEKDVRPTRFAEGRPVHYDWPLTPGQHERGRDHFETLTTAARSITHLGWGVDQAVGHAALFDAAPPADPTVERWLPAAAGGAWLQVPRAGTLADLRRKYADFLGRLGPEGFSPVPPLTAFDVVGYRRATDAPPRPFAAFSILKPDGSGFRAFDSSRRATVVAGMVRHALGLAAKAQRPFGWSDERIASIVCGHGPDGGPVKTAAGDQRFAFLPLPTIEPRPGRGEHVGMIRRVLVVGRPGMEAEVGWVRRALSGSELVAEGTQEVKALLSLIPASDRVVQRYVRPSPAWATVTPVVIPGFSDRRAAKMERLLRKALGQAGVPTESAETAELEWRNVGFLPGVDLASHYRRPRNASEAPVQHVKIRWRDAQGQPVSMPGPFAAGSGRFRGLGLFLPVAD